MAIPSGCYRVKRMTFVWNSAQGYIQHLAALSGSSAFNQLESKVISNVLKELLAKQKKLTGVILVDADNKVIYMLKEADAMIDHDNLFMLPISVNRVEPIKNETKEEQTQIEKECKVAKSKMTEESKMNLITAKQESSETNGGNGIHLFDCYDEHTVEEVKEQRVEALLNDIFDKIGTIWLKVMSSDITETYTNLKQLMMQWLTTEDLNTGSEEVVLERCVELLYRTGEFDNVQYDRIRHYISIVPVSHEERKTLRMIGDILVCDVLGDRSPDRLKTNMSEEVLEKLNRYVKCM
jgi:hypothetical protein